MFFYIPTAMALQITVFNPGLNSFLDNFYNFIFNIRITEIVICSYNL
jgi:hypothetical protein